MSIESAVLTWVNEVTGLDPWQAPIDTSLDKPEGEYITFQVLSVVMSEFNHIDAKAKDAEFITKTTKNNAKLLMSFNVFSYQGYMKLALLNASETFWQHRNTLAIDGLSVNRLGNPQNLTGLGDTNFVDRWQMDVEFMISIENENDWDRLDSIRLAGEFVTQDDNDTISGLIKWPLV